MFNPSGPPSPVRQTPRLPGPAVLPARRCGPGVLPAGHRGQRLYFPVRRWHQQLQHVRRRLSRMTAAPGSRKSTKKKTSAQCVLRCTENYNTRIPVLPARAADGVPPPRTSGFRNSHGVGGTPGLTVDGAKKAPAPEGAEGGCVFAGLFVFCFISRCLSSWIISISQTTEHLQSVFLSKTSTSRFQS